MAVRIYSLAKDIGLDSKELVDLCTRLGILNKGSALASLDDDEITKIKKHLAEKSAPAAPASPAPVPTREPLKEPPIRDPGARFGAAKRDLAANAKRSPIQAKRGETQPETTSEDVEAETPVESESEPVVVETPPTSVETTPPTPVVVAETPASIAPPELPPETPASPAPEQAGSPALKRNDYYAPAQTSGRVRVLGRPRTGGAPGSNPGESGKPAADKSAPDKKKARQPVLNLSPIPKSATPSPTPKSQEPAIQKPIVKLTPDVIKGIGQGMEKPTEKPKTPSTPGSKSSNTGRAATPSQTMHAGLADFKANAENKLNQKNKKVIDEERDTSEQEESSGWCWSRR